MPYRKLERLRTQIEDHIFRKYGQMPVYSELSKFAKDFIGKSKEGHLIEAQLLLKPEIKTLISDDSELGDMFNKTLFIGEEIQQDINSNVIKLIPVED